MGLLTFALNVTLDGCCDHREMVADDEMHRYWTRVMDAAGAMLFERQTYALMEDAWPQVARDPKAARSSRDWAKKLDAKPKYVVSTTRRDFPWSNTHHVQGDLTRAVKVLKKATPGGLLAVPVSTASSAMTPPDMSITISRAAMVRLSNSPETARGPPASPNSFLLQSCHLNCAPPWGRRKRSSRASLIRRYGCLVK